MKDLKFITICPIDNYFIWQVHMWLESLRNINLSQKAIVLLFEPLNRTNPKWEQIIKLFPEVEFNLIKDDGTVAPFIGTYIPIIRPWTAMKYWEQHPEMKEKAVFYCDSDILFTDKFNIDKFLDDDIIYCSDTNSYINATYFDSKVKDVLPEKLEEYKTLDVLDTASRIAGINRQICEKNNMHSGGTQYLFKNIDKEYWQKVFEGCIPVIKYLGGINRQYFANENKGFQKWTSDMWLVIWELWRRGQETKVVKELEFAWVHDPIEKLQRLSIYHNAGATNEGTEDFPIFYKGKYHTGTSPFTDPHLDKILNSEKTKKHCTWYYANELDKLRKKYEITYI